MKQTITPRQPSSGQFVAFWIYEEQLWSTTYRINDEGQLEEYTINEKGNDEWVLLHGNTNLVKDRICDSITDLQFITKE